MMADLVVEGARTLAFVRSRHGAEQTALGAQRPAAASAGELAPGWRLPRRLPARGTAGTGGRAGFRCSLTAGCHKKFPALCPPITRREGAPCGASD